MNIHGPESSVDEMQISREVVAVIATAIACTLGEVTLFANTHITAYRPPNVLAVTLALVAVACGMIGFFGLRRTARAGLWRVIMVASVLVGVAGPLLFGYQSFQWRADVEAVETRNVQTILTAAHTWAQTHHGAWPADLDTMVRAGLLDPTKLISPVAQEGRASAATQPRGPVLDYRYVGEGLHGTLPAGTDVLAAYTSGARLGQDFLVAYADGRIVWVKDEDLLATVEKSNAARVKMGLAPVIAQLNGYTLMPDATAPATATAPAAPPPH